MNNDGSKMRPWDNTEEMDEALVKNWNSVVRDKDKVYHLGDVVINRKALPILSRLNGEKILIKGNHDIFRLNEYTPYFKDIRGTHKLDNFLLSHIPIHPESVARWCGGNIHGHLHSNVVMTEEFDQHKRDKFDDGEMVSIIDKRYLCVSVEQINYTPISLEEVKKIMRDRNG